jgi:hypothetical protein
MLRDLKKKSWRDLVSAESKEGTWELFNVGGHLRLVFFAEGKSNHTFDHVEIEITEEEWLDLVQLIKRIA